MLVIAQLCRYSVTCFGIFSVKFIDTFIFDSGMLH